MTLYEHGDFTGQAEKFDGIAVFDLQALVNYGTMNGKVSALRVEGSDCAATLYQHDSEGQGEGEATFTEGIYPAKAFTDGGAVTDDVQSMKVFKV